jgi:hypothetical protein
MPYDCLSRCPVCAQMCHDGVGNSVGAGSGMLGKLGGSALVVRGSEAETARGLQSLRLPFCL